MVKKCLLVGLAVVLLMVLGGIVSCGKGIAGTYVNQDNPSQSLELKEDGTFSFKENDVSLDGEWEAEGDELKVTYMGEVATCQIEGNKIIDPDGGVWVKQ